jgi:hypothetical protein
MVGHVAWVAFNGKSTFAVVGDTGPAFGEGSIALHQLLRYGQLAPQLVGPDHDARALLSDGVVDTGAIRVASRCGKRQLQAW